MRKERFFYKRSHLFICLILVLTISVYTVNSQTKPSKKPNIVWFICEDISPTLAFYGDSTAYTPNLNQLAKESMVFENCFTTVGVCAPSRATLITGMYPTSVGTMNHRTAQDAMGWGARKYNAQSPLKAVDIKGQVIREYSAVVPSYVKCFTELLREKGYYCTNNYKTDYNFASPVTAWDENSTEASWETRSVNKPFFSVFTFLTTHESMIWVHKRDPQTVSPNNIVLPPYFPDDPVVREDVARNYSNIEELDKVVGKKIKDLKDQGLYENTIIFFFSDNGGPLPRGKRETLDSGLHVPFMVRLPQGSGPGKVNDLISFVDFAPTVLSLANIKAPKYMQGQAFLGHYKPSKERKYIYGSGDRFDEFTDQIRAVRDKRYLYVKNYYPELPSFKDVSYRKKMNLMNRLLVLRDENKISGVTALWFKPNKAEEELYDCLTDPYNIHNLIDNPLYIGKIREMRIALDNWRTEYGDMGNIAEAQLIEQMWPDNIQPETLQPSN